MSRIESNLFDWPNSSLGLRLKYLEESLLCSICGDFAENPQSLNCGHTYCSICIRKHFDRKINSVTFNQCPSCREKAELCDLRCNKSLYQTLTAFVAVRADLLKLVENYNVSASNRSSESMDLVCKVKKSSPERHIAIRRLPHKDFHKWSKDKIKKEIVTLCSASPVCLSVDGSAEDLDRRYRELVHLNNAQLDSSKPMSFDQCIKDINKKEHAKLVEQRNSSQSAAKVEQLRNGKMTTSIEDGFKSLAKSVRERKRKALLANSSSNEHENMIVSDDGMPADIEAIDNPSSTGVVVASGSSIDACASDIMHEMAATASVWRVVYSDKLRRPFYFNESTGIGQFALPSGVEFSNIYHEARLRKAHSPTECDQQLMDHQQSSQETQLHPFASPLLDANIDAPISAGLDCVNSPMNAMESITTYTANSVEAPLSSSVMSTGVKSVSAANADSQDSLLDLGDRAWMDASSPMNTLDDLNPIPLMSLSEDDSDDSVEFVSPSVSEEDTGSLVKRQRLSLFVNNIAVDSSKVKHQKQPSASSQPVAVSSSSTWSCELCTFINQMSSRQCEMCGTPNPANVKQQSLGLRNAEAAASNTRSLKRSSSVISKKGSGQSQIPSTSGKTPGRSKYGK